MKQKTKMPDNVILIISFILVSLQDRALLHGPYLVFLYVFFS